MKSPFEVSEQAADKASWTAEEELANALNFLYAHPELWTEFEQFGDGEVAEQVSGAETAIDDAVNE